MNEKKNLKSNQLIQLKATELLENHFFIHPLFQLRTARAPHEIIDQLSL